MSEFGPAGPSPHRRILASAGCGKTYALSSRFLELVHRGEKPGAILASTFSRAAAAEIRDRVLRRAAEAVGSLGQREELGRAMGAVDFGEPQAHALLHALVAALPRLQIRTIDSLFGAVTMAFAAELGLPPEPRVVDEGEEKEVLRAAIASHLAEVPEDQAIETLTSLAKGARRIAVVPAIERAIGGLMSLLLDSAADAWDWDAPAGPPADELDRAVEELEGLAESAEKKSIATAIRSDLGRLATARSSGGEAWSSLPKAGLVRALREGDVVYSRVEIPGAVRDAYRPVLAAVDAGIQRTYAFMTRATHQLLVGVESCLGAEKRRRGVVTFEDLTRALDPAHVDLPALDEVWFRLDARVQHLLLDEFQDTSAAQWRALRPIAGEIGATGDGLRSLFAVGDLKQSIYGWRGGEPGLLERLDEVTIEDGVVDFLTEPLLQSYRSSQPVIDVVNVIFGGVGASEVVQEQSLEAAATWARWFAPHTTCKSELPGFAGIFELPAPGEDQKPDDVRVRHAAEAARRHFERLRGSGAEVAVLVRRNEMVGRVVAALKHLGVPADGRGGGSLFDAEAVLATIQALRLAECPDDTVAAFDLANSPLSELVGFGAGRAPHRDADRRAVASSLQARFARHGVTAVVDRWRRLLDPVLDAREVVRMRQLVEVLERLEAVAQRSPGELVELLRVARVDEPGGSGVTVLNVHQSKGLEFDVVIVADLGAPLGLSGSREKVAWCSPPRPAEPIPRVTRWVAEPLLWDESRHTYDDSQTRGVLESLCVLYVALTRAKHGLEVHVDPVARKKNGEETETSRKSVSAVVRAVLQDGTGQTSDQVGALVPLWSAGASTDWSPPCVTVVEDLRPEPGTPRLRVGSRRLRRAPSASTRTEDRSGLFRISDGEAADCGRALHACFEQVAWIDDGTPDQAELAAAVRRAVPTRAAGWIAERVLEFHAALARPAIEAFLRRPAAPVEVRCEHRYARLTEAGLEEGAIDRLVLHRDGAGAIRAVDVVDFKTGAGEDPHALVDQHGPQLRAYRDVVVEQFRVPPEAVRMWIAATAAGVVVEVEG